jgi:antitoxin (DNA-binding transcriptional repressor) of toxin-antitoxin stability system
MMKLIVNIQDAKTNLSKLLVSVEHGEEVIIANRGKPVAKLEAIITDEKRRLGFVKGSLPESFFDPLPEEELSAWDL